MAQVDWFIEIGLGVANIQGGSAPESTILRLDPCVPGRICPDGTIIGGLSPKDDSYGKLAVGRKLGNWNIDLAYLEFGSFEDKRVIDKIGFVGGNFSEIEAIKSDVAGINLSIGRGINLVGNLSVFGKVGIAYYENDSEEITTVTNGRLIAAGVPFPSACSGSECKIPSESISAEYVRSNESDGVEVNYAIGLLYSVTDSFDLKLEYQAFQDIGPIDIDTTSIGFIWKF